MDWQIPLFKMFQDKEDVRVVSELIRSGMNWAAGPEVNGFEEALARYHNVDYCLTFNSGTSALHAVMLAFGLGQGDEVIVPSFSFISTANASLFVGARPVFADIEEETLGLDASDVTKKITPMTKAVLPMHYAGCPCQIDELKQVARERNILLIEDAAEAMGAEINGIRVGSFGDAAILSFCQNKIITTGEGGAVLTGSKEIYEKLKLIRSHGRLENADYFTTTEDMDYVTLGYNFRMSSILAALGVAQLEKAPKLIEMRRKNARLMDEELSSVKGITISPVPPEGFSHVYQMYTIMVPGHLRSGLIKFLEDNGIMSKVYFSPVHQTRFYMKELGYDCHLPVTEKVSEKILSLPIYPGLTEREILKISGLIAEFMHGNQ